MSGFDLDWLRTREPFDLAARDRGCAARFAAALRGHGSRPIRVLDLAAGSGASFRALAPIIGVEQDWVLVDHDARLHSAQPVEIESWAKALGWRGNRNDEWMEVDTGAARWRARGQACALDCDFDRMEFAGFDGVTTSAFLDLASQDWLNRLARKLDRSRLPLLAALSVDGKRAWLPALPDDDAVLAAFERHQCGDKGFGPALGVAAAHHLAGLLDAAGYEVTLARSDWRIGSDATALLGQLLDDTVRASCEARSDRAREFAAWADTRRAQLAACKLSLVVGHLDLLALPSGRGRSTR